MKKFATKRNAGNLESFAIKTSELAYVNGGSNGGGSNKPKKEREAQLPTT